MVCVPFLFPVKGCDAINIDCGDNGRNDILKQWLLPFLYLQSGSGVCFFYKAIPAPSKTAAAEQCKDERAERKDIGGNDKIPEIQPCRAVCKRLKMDEIKTKCGGQGKKKDNDSADQTLAGTSRLIHEPWQEYFRRRQAPLTWRQKS